jgi:hypothetical protein
VVVHAFNPSTRDAEAGAEGRGQRAEGRGQRAEGREAERQRGREAERQRGRGRDRWISELKDSLV